NLQILTALLHFAIYAIFFVIARSLGADLALLPTMSVILLVSVISYVVPTPGGSGYLEFALSYVFSRQVPAALVTPSVLAWRVVTFYLPLLIGPFLGGPMLARTLAGGNGDSAKHTSPE
ncbi:MAG TPA: lysylphosphatidylglycerol synthase domain-containing protein, partial [Trueperaceae bacterium]